MEVTKPYISESKIYIIFHFWMYIISHIPLIFVTFSANKYNLTYFFPPNFDIIIVQNCTNCILWKLDFNKDIVKLWTKMLKGKCGLYCTFIQYTMYNVCTMYIIIILLYVDCIRIIHLKTVDKMEISNHIWLI